MSRTGMPGTRLACSILRISPDAEWSRVCTISTTTCTCSDEVPGNPDAGLNASNTTPGVTPDALPPLRKILCRGSGAGARVERLDHVAGAHAVRPPAIDEDDLLGTGEHMEIPRRDHDALEPRRRV